MNTDAIFYYDSCEFIKDLMKRHTPMQSFAEIVYPLLKLFRPKDLSRNLISLVVTEQPNHNASEYFPLAYHILDKHPEFYNDKPKELAAFAWEMSGKLGCNDSTDELFETIINKLGKYINYDYLEEIKNNKGASSIAHQIFYNKNSKSKIIPLMLGLGANFITPSNNYNSALDRHFINWSEGLKFNDVELDKDFLDTIKVLLTHEKTKNSYIEHLDKYPDIKNLGVIQSVQLTMQLEKNMPVKKDNIKTKKI